jgi:ABC-type microcin C transport system permease subunit YejB
LHGIPDIVWPEDDMSLDAWRRVAIIVSQSVPRLVFVTLILLTFGVTFSELYRMAFQILCGQRTT